MFAVGGTIVVADVAVNELSTDLVGLEIMLSLYGHGYDAAAAAVRSRLLDEALKG